MISKMIPDVTPRGLGGASAGSTSDRKLAGGENAPNEFEELLRGPDRNERKEDKPGRESEGKRSKERDPISRTASKVEPKKPLKKSAAAGDRKAKSTEDVSKSVHAAHVMKAPIVNQPQKVEGDVEEATDISVDAASGTSADSSAESADGNETTAALTKAKTEIDKQEAIRTSAMSDFLDHMKSDFGIEPEQIMDAYSKMSDSAMAGAPENSVNEFLAQLPIPKEQLGAATDLYKQMISTTKESDMSEKLAMMDATLDVLDSKLTEMDSDPEFMSLGAKDQALTKLGEAADQLNAMITSDSGPAAVKAQAALDAMNARLLMMRQGSTEDADIDLALDNADIDGLDNFDDSMMEVDDVVLAPTATAAGALNGADSAEAVTPQAQSQAGGNESNGESGQGDQSSSKKASNTAASKAAQEPAPTDEVKKTAAKDVSPEVKPLNDLSTAQLPNQANGAVPKAPTFQIGSTSSTAAILDRPVTPQEEADNIKQLLNQTQIAMKKGGGEVEMIMKPEGLGSVKVKVSMLDGQLNIQMLTENNSAKKLLEKGLGELRTSLTQSQFKVDHLKVDVGADIKQHMDQNQNQGQSREQARQFAQDFMGRFGEERRGFRQGLMESSGPRRSYGSAQRPDMVAADTVRSAGVSGSKRLNVVA